MFYFSSYVFICLSNLLCHFTAQEIALPETKWYSDESASQLDAISKNTEVHAVVDAFPCLMVEAIFND